MRIICLVPSRPVRVSSEDYDIHPHVVLLLNGLNDCAVYALSERPVSASAVALAIPEDVNLRQVMAWCLAGWPDQDPGGAFSPYYLRRDAISMVNGCLLWGERVIVPTKMRQDVLHMLHQGHLGVSRTQALARLYV